VHILFIIFQKYFQSSSTGKSYLSIEWTNQHGCGGNEDTNPQKQNCQLVLQYMCQKDVTSPTGLYQMYLVFMNDKRCG